MTLSEHIRRLAMPGSILVVAAAWVFWNPPTRPVEPVPLPLHFDQSRISGHSGSAGPLARDAAIEKSLPIRISTSLELRRDTHGESAKVVSNPYVTEEDGAFQLPAPHGDKTILRGNRNFDSPAERLPDSSAVREVDWETVVVPSVVERGTRGEAPLNFGAGSLGNLESVKNETARAIPFDDSAILVADSKFTGVSAASIPLSENEPGIEASKPTTSLQPQPPVSANFPKKGQRQFHGNEVPPEAADFDRNPLDGTHLAEPTFDPAAEIQIYQGKTLNATQRPLLELGRPWYQLGQLSPPQTYLGRHNPIHQQFVVFGDSRTAVAAHRTASDSQSLWAVQSNLFVDWKWTGTERIHFNLTPATQGADSSRWLLDEDRFISEFNLDINFGFFEGDLGALAGGFRDRTLPFDMPIAIGVLPLVMQNGVWLEDAFLGAAVTLPAQHSAYFDISNFDLTAFVGWDKLNSPAFGIDDNAAKVYGLASWIEAGNGYLEVDYAFIEDRDNQRDRSYHNVGIGFTRRYGHFLSNSMRLIVNAGQSTDGGPNTADGVLLLSENSLITANPSTLLPYFNLFAGFDRPQSVARAGQAGGILRNTGILFESDNLTGYPTLDATANQAYGFAAGLSLMPQDFSQQLVLEAAWLGVMGDDLGRNAAGNQRGLGLRYQLPLSHSIIIRLDGMYGFLADSGDVSGLRVELRKKF